MKRLSILAFSFLFVQSFFAQNSLSTQNGALKSEATLTPVELKKGNLNINHLQATPSFSNQMECSGPFLKYFGEEGIREYGMNMAQTLDGNFLVSGGRGNSSLLMLLNPEGVPIWEKTFDMTGGDDFIYRLLIDSDGRVLATGRDQPNSATDNFMFLYDIQNEVMLWSKSMPNPSNTRIEKMVENPVSGNYIIVGMTDNPFTSRDVLVMEMDRLTGDKVWLRTYDSGSTTETALSVEVDNSSIFITSVLRYGGLNQIRASISRFDLGGNQLWTRNYFEQPNGSARQLMYDLSIVDNQILALSHGDRIGSSNITTSVQLLKTTIDGEAIWAKDYHFGPNSNSLQVRNLLVVPGGFVIQGFHNFNGERDVFLLRTDEEGSFLWAKSFGGMEDETSISALVFNQSIYITGTSSNFDSSDDILFGAIGIDGNIEGSNCGFVSDLVVFEEDIFDPFDDQNDLEEVIVDYELLDGPNNENSLSIQNDFFPNCECETTPPCDTTFLKTYGTPTDHEDSRAIAGVPQSLGGGFLLGGGKADSAMITWVDEVGDIIWTRSFDATFDAEDYVTDLLFDSDNIVVGVGQTKNEPQNNRECFIFRYDMVNNSMLWINELDLNDPANETYVSIVEKSPGGNYVVSGQTDDFIGGNGCDGILVEVDRITGTNQWQQNLTLGSCETFSQIVIADGGIFATGRYNFDGGGTARMRPGITRFDSNGNQLWSRLYLEAVSSSDIARLYSADLVDDDGLVVLGHGDGDGTSTSDNEVFLYRTDYDGNLEWARSIDLPGATSERGLQLLNTPDGYLCLGTYTVGSDVNSYILKTNKAGEIQWSKSYGQTGENERAWDMVCQNNRIYFSGSTSVGGSNEDIFLTNIAADGTVTGEGDCNLFTDLQFVESAWQNPYDGQHDLTELNDQWGVFLGTAIMGETAVQTTVECFTPCQDSCELLPEAVLNGVSAQCNGAAIRVAFEICNTGDFELPTGTPIAIYEEDPTAGIANVLTSFLLPGPIASGDCVSYFQDISGVPNTTYFILVNADGTVPTPIDLATYGGVEEECDLTNNLGSFFVDFEEPELDLGPDILICENQTVVLDAGSEFSTYLWNDGSEMQTLAVNSPGTYSVTVTDECGGVQEDEITLSIDPASIFDIGPDQDICEGGVINYDLGSFFFDTYTWMPMAGVTCLNPECSEVIVSPTADMTYTVVASNADGCLSQDSFFVAVLESIEVIEDVSICEGDTATVFGNPVTTTGEFSMTFVSENGCDSIHTISVGVIDTIVTQEEILLCWGDSVEVFGEVVYGGGPYQMTFSSEIGCDSTHVITLVGHPKIFLIPQVMPVTCFGGSDGAANANVLAGGLGPLTYLWDTGDTTIIIDGLTAGTYSVTVTDGVCPESATVEVLEPDEIIVMVSGVNVGCSTPGSASASATGGAGNFSYEWSNGEEGSELNDLEAGTYMVTATDDSGCTGVGQIEILGASGPSVSISIDALPTTIDTTGGALSALTSGGSGPFTFEWSNGGSGASQTGLTSGEYSVTVTDANGCTDEATIQIFLPACTGGKIWNDANRDGCQDGGELGIGGIELELNGTDIFGNPVSMTTLSAINGEYIFEPLPPGDYQVTLPLPSGYSYSPANACSDDFTDSDFDGSGLSYMVNLTEGHCCLVVDGGLYDDCINVFDSGEICCNQVLCGPGVDPAPIESVSPAAGAFAVEYMWMYSLHGPSFSNGTWVGIPGTNTLNYDPGPIQETTYFARCVRGVGCNEWLETNVVEILVDDIAVAEITAPQYICVGDEVVFNSAGNPGGATYHWNFGPTANPNTSSDETPTVTFNQGGYPTVTLSVTYNDCISTDTELLAVSNSPIYCGTAIQNPEENSSSISFNEFGSGTFNLYPNPTSDYLTLRWSEPLGEVINIELLSIDGRILRSEKVDGLHQYYQVDLVNMVSGVYMFRVSYGAGEAEVFRVLKE